MKKTLTLGLFIVGIFIGLATFLPQPLQAAPALSVEQEKAVEALIRDYLTKNPEVIGDAIQALTEKQRLAERDQVKQRIAQQSSEIFDSPHSLSDGNPEGDITLVEFFDYNCPYCKKGHADLLEMIKSDGNIRIVYKEFPILGPDSVLAAKAALAAHKQGKYLEFSEHLLTMKGRANDFTIEEAAAAVGLDYAQMEHDMKDPAFDVVLKENRQLAASLGISGTPAFLVGDELIPGFMEASKLKKVIDAAREKRQEK